VAAAHEALSSVEIVIPRYSKIYLIILYISILPDGLISRDFPTKIECTVLVSYMYWAKQNGFDLYMEYSWFES
jgi:hypothetical protein